MGQGRLLRKIWVCASFHMSVSPPMGPPTAKHSLPVTVAARRKREVFAVQSQVTVSPV